MTLMEPNVVSGGNDIFQSIRLQCVGWLQVEDLFTANYNEIAADLKKDNAKWNGGDPVLGFKCAPICTSLRPLSPLPLLF
jgi:hypothetical protein